MRHNGLLGFVIEGCVEDKNFRGKSWMEYMQQTVKDQGCDSYKETKKTSTREEWRIATNRMRDWI